MAFRLTLKGNKAVLKGLEKIRKEAAGKIADEIEASAYNIHAGAVQRAPVDKGFLKNSITVQNTPLTARIEAGVHYAPYIEFGTGGMVDVPAGLEDYAIQFKGKGVRQISMQPQPFLFPAFEAERPRLIENIKKVLNEPK